MNIFIPKIHLFNTGSSDITGHENYHKRTQTLQIFNFNAANCWFNFDAPKTIDLKEIYEYWNDIS